MGLRLDLPKFIKKKGLRLARFIKPYPKLRGVTGIRRQGRGITKWSLIRQQRPRRHAKSWRWKTRLDPHAALEERATKKVRGSLQERIVFKALEGHGFINGVDFTFQTSQLGGRQRLGGLVADFLFELPKAIVQVQSMWHNVTAALERRDEDQYAILQSMGYTVFEIWPESIENQDALDDWIGAHLMSLWGTSSQGIGAGVANDIPYMTTVAMTVLNRIDLRIQSLLREIGQAYVGRPIGELLPALGVPIVGQVALPEGAPTYPAGPLPEGGSRMGVFPTGPVVTIDDPTPRYSNWNQ